MKIPNWAQFQMALKAVEVAIHCCHEAEAGEAVTDYLLRAKVELDAERLTREMAEAVAVSR